MFDNSRVHQLYREQLVSRPLDDVFAFFAEADNPERITPPWLGFGPCALRAPARTVGRTGAFDVRGARSGADLRLSARRSGEVAGMTTLVWLPA
jgi:hypothetical protein